MDAWVASVSWSAGENMEKGLCIILILPNKVAFYNTFATYHFIIILWAIIILMMFIVYLFFCFSK